MVFLIKYVGGLFDSFSLSCKIVVGAYYLMWGILQVESIVDPVARVEPIETVANS